MPRSTRYACFTVLLTLCMPVIVAGSDFPPLPLVLPPQHPAPPVLPRRLLPATTPFKPPTSKADLDALALSPNMYLWALARLQKQGQAVSTRPMTLTSAALSEPLSGSRRHGRFTPVALSAPGRQSFRPMSIKTENQPRPLYETALPTRKRNTPRGFR